MLIGSTKKIFISILAFSLILLSVSCSPKEYINSEILNIEYKTGLKLDIYQPAVRLYSKAPVVIYFHGGGWISGDKDEISNTFAPVLKELRENGIAVISADYSLIDTLKSKNYTDCISDAIDCADWVFQNSSEYGFDTSKICVMGYSAGAYLALMTSYTDNTDEHFSGTYENVSKGKIKLCIDISGPVVFTDEYSEDYSTPSLDMYSQYLFDQSSETYYDDLYDSSLLNNIDKNDDGTSLLIYTGDDDEVVPLSHSNELYSLSVNSGLDVQYISFAGISHYLTVTENSFKSVYTFSDICAKISSDIVEILKK